MVADVFQTLETFFPMFGKTGLKVSKGWKSFWWNAISERVQACSESPLHLLRSFAAKNLPRFVKRGEGTASTFPDLGKETVGR